MTFSIGSQGGYTTPLWGETMEWQLPFMSLALVEGRDVSDHVLEFRQGDERLEVVPSRWRRNNELENGCGVSEMLDFDITGFEPGEYLVVHRRDTGTGDKINCLGGCPWELFEGEEALVLRLVVLPETTVPPDDAGRDSDASPDGTVGGVSPSPTRNLPRVTAELRPLNRGNGAD